MRLYVPERHADGLTEPVEVELPRRPWIPLVWRHIAVERPAGGVECGGEHPGGTFASPHFLPPGGAEHPPEIGGAQPAVHELPHGRELAADPAAVRNVFRARPRQPEAAPRTPGQGAAAAGQAKTRRTPAAGTAAASRPATAGAIGVAAAKGTASMIAPDPAPSVPSVPSAPRPWPVATRVVCGHLGHSPGPALSG